MKKLQAKEKEPWNKRLLKMWKVLMLVATISLLHSAHSAGQYIKYLKMNSQSETPIPNDITLQCIFSFMVLVIGIIKTAGEFEKIQIKHQLVKM